MYCHDPYSITGKRVIFPQQKPAQKRVLLFSTIPMYLLLLSFQIKQVDAMYIVREFIKSEKDGKNALKKVPDACVRKRISRIIYGKSVTGMEVVMPSVRPCPR
jgi:hypothetical protein